VSLSCLCNVPLKIKIIGDKISLKTCVLLSEIVSQTLHQKTNSPVQYRTPGNPKQWTGRGTVLFAKKLFLKFLKTFKP